MNARPGLLLALLAAVLVAAFAGIAARGEESPDRAAITVTGRVLGPDGVPLAGAVVLADNGGSYQVVKSWTETPWRHWVPDPLAAASVGPFTRRATSPTGDDGRFRVDGVPGPAGRGWVVVVHPGFATLRADAPGGAAGGVLDVGDLRLREGATVRATVRTADGRAAPDAWVVVRSATPTSPDRSPSSWAWGEEPGDVRVGRTDADGTCVVRGVTPGRLRVAAFTRSHVPAVAEADGVAGRAADVALRIAAGASLRVQVVTQGPATPVGGARVLVETTDAGRSWPGPAPLASTRTGADGTATVEGLERLDEYRVTVVPPDFATDTVHSPGPFHVAAVAKPGATVRVELAPQVRFAVRVADAYTKVPLEGAKVALWPDWKRFDPSAGQPIELSLAWDAGTRTYVTPHARPGGWTVAAWAPGHLPGGATNVRIAAADAEAVEVVELGPATAFATGRVVERSTGRPVPGASVASYEWIQRMNDGHRASATTADDGTFRLAPLLGANFPLRVEVTAPGYVWALLERKEGERPAELGDVALVRAATVRGRVTDAEGRPLARVGVVLVPAEFRTRGKGEGWDATTDDAGRYEITGLRPGEYVIQGAPDASPIRLAEGESVVRDVVR